MVENSTTTLRHRILIIDAIDEHTILLNNTLKNEYEILFTDDAKKAVLIADLKKPSLIILEFSSDKINGEEICIALRNNPSTCNIPIIFFSEKDHALYQMEGFDLGAVDYITKPFNPEIMKRRIAAHIMVHSKNKELQKEVYTRVEEINNTRVKLIHKLCVAAEYKDDETTSHLIRMSHYCRIIATEYGLDDSQIEIIVNASPLHDIGKIGISDTILLKKGKLSKSERTQMMLHSEIGANILGKDKDPLLSAAYYIAYQHHEKWDGKGYPFGIGGTRISIYARIVALADVFDALTSVRPYKNLWDIDDAVEYIEDESGKSFDPQVVEAFKEALPQIKSIKAKIDKSYS